MRDGRLTVIFVDGPYAGVPHTFGRGTMYIGRDPEAQLVVDSPRVAAKHAEIRVAEYGATLVDRSAGWGVYYRDAAIRVLLLDPGREYDIALGHVHGPRLRVRYDGPATVNPKRTWVVPVDGAARRARSPGDRAVVQVALPRPAAAPGGRSSGTPPPEPIRLVPFTADIQLVVNGWVADEFALAGSSIVIGRSQECDVAVPPACDIVSGRHAELRGVEGTGVVLVDLGSRNGTYLGGRPISRAVLPPGSLHDVQLGQGGPSLHVRVSALEP